MNDNYVDTVAASKPKSDQLNADDLISSNMIIKITAVCKGNSQQPIAIHFENDNRKPWYPCKSMIRVLRCLFTDDSRKWVGQYVELFNDPTVKWAGVEVGGIRIKGASGIECDTQIIITENRKSRKPVKIHRLDIQAPVVNPVKKDEIGIDSPVFSRAVEAIKNGAATLEAAMRKYTFTAEALNKLKELKNETV